jgi:murein DD-endopeptidase MepM/ murein hydrolase activator NlpD
MFDVKTPAAFAAESHVASQSLRYRISRSVMTGVAAGLMATAVILAPLADVQAGERDRPHSNEVSLDEFARQLDQKLTLEGEQQAASEKHKIDADLRQELDRLEAAVNAVLGDQESLQLERADLQDELVDLRLKASRLDQALADAEEKSAAMQQERTRLLTRVDRFTREGNDLGNQQRRLSQELNAAQKRHRDLRVAQRALIESLQGSLDGSIEALEESLAITGLNIDELLGKQGDTGMGGPFIAADSTLASGEPLADSVDQLDSNLRRWEALQQLASLLPISSPVESYRVTSFFGPRRDPVNGRRAIHKGIDFKAPLRTPVLSSGAGQVTFAGWKRGFGRVIEISHDHGLVTRYAHLRKILVKRGQEVEQGATIGQVGNSGRATGVHLHYEILRDGKALDPLKFLKAGGHVS